MEKQTHIDDDGNNVLLKSIILALVVICFGIVRAVKGTGDSANFPGRAKWLAIHILRTLPRVFNRTAENLFATKKRYDAVAQLFEEAWNEIFGHTVKKDNYK